MAQLQYSVEEAEQFLADGTPAAADVVIRSVLSRHPRDPKAWRTISRLATAIREEWFAARYGAVAEALDLTQSARIAELPGPKEPGLPARDPERFLLIKAWGYGFCSDLDHLLGALLTAEMTGRTPVTHWGTNSLFKLESGQDAYRAYFEPLSAPTIQDLQGKGHDYWPPKWSDANLLEERVNKQVGEHSRVSALQLLNRPERVVVSDFHTGVQMLAHWLKPGHPAFARPLDEVIRYVMTTHLRPRQEIVAEVDAFAAKRFTARPVIGAHVRGGDKFIEDPQHEQRIQGIMKSVDFQLARNPNASVFLMTDSAPIVEAYKKRYGPKLITTECTRTINRTGLHYLGSKDRKKLGVEVLRDVLLALKCDMFVGMGSSNVAATIYHWKAWAPGTINILGPLINHMQDVMQFMTPDQLKRYFPAHQVDSWIKGWV